MDHLRGVDLLEHFGLICVSVLEFSPHRQSRLHTIDHRIQYRGKTVEGESISRM